MKKGVLGVLLRGNRGWSHESVLVMLRVATCERYVVMLKWGCCS
jgi:hypothetical protein